MEKLKQLSLAMKCVILGIVAVVLVTVLLLIVFKNSGKDTLEVQSALKDVLETSQLRTVEYKYNSIAEVKDGDTVKYYVAYNGKASVSLNFEDIEIVRDGEIIRVIVPEPTQIDINLEDDFDFLFMKKKYETETVYIEAKAACEKDLREKVNSSEAVKEAAKKSAEATIGALLEPFKAQLAEGEEFKIVFKTAEGEAK